MIHILSPGHHCIDLEAFHRELHTRDPSARRYLILPAGPYPSSPWGLQEPVLPHAQQQGPARPPASSFEDLGRGSEMLGGFAPIAGHEGGQVPGGPREMREKVLLAKPGS